MSTGVCDPDQILSLAWDAKNLETLFITVRLGRLVSFTTMRASQSANCIWLLFF